MLSAICSVTQGLTWLDQHYYKDIKKYGPISLRNKSEFDASVPLLTEYELRVIRAVENRDSEPVWPGLTWVLDLLPYWPRVAIDAISAYFLAHAQVLSDLRLNGLDDATAIIRYRYIVQDPAARKSKVAFLRSLDPIDIEYLAAALYAAMKYKVEITPGQKDGGVDVVATKENEVIFIECKNWEERVNVETVRAFTAAVLSEPASRGVMISVSGFTDKGPMSATDWVGAPMRRARMELVDGQKFVQLLNEFLGVDWNSKIDKLLLRKTLEMSENKWPQVSAMA